MVTDIIGAYELRINTWSPHLPIDHHFADDIFKCILVKENISILIQITVDAIPYYEIDNNSTLVQMMFGAEQATGRYLNNLDKDPSRHIKWLGYNVFNNVYTSSIYKCHIALLNV